MRPAVSWGSGRHGHRLGGAPTTLALRPLESRPEAGEGCRRSPSHVAPIAVPAPRSAPAACAVGGGAAHVALYPRPPLLSPLAPSRSLCAQAIILMQDYYATTLSGARLRQCYELAPPRVQQYLFAEIEFVAHHVQPYQRVLELGCGYGRVLHRLADRAHYALGIDTSSDSLQLARQAMAHSPNCGLCRTNAGNLAIRDAQFDVVVCIQNGVAVFGISPHQIAREAARVTRPGGRVFLSSYAAGFWEHRLEWFSIQAKHGLVGEIDHAGTGNGVIACRDGFRASALTPTDFQALAAVCQLECRITEVDGSSLMCEMVVPELETPGAPRVPR